MSKTVHEVRIGLIKASVYCKRTRSGIRYQVSAVRLYRNGDCWKQSVRFGRDDLPVLRLAIDKAHTWITQQATWLAEDH